LRNNVINGEKKKKKKNEKRFSVRQPVFKGMTTANQDTPLSLKKNEGKKYESEEKNLKYKKLRIWEKVGNKKPNKLQAPRELRSERRERNESGKKRGRKTP